MLWFVVMTILPYLGKSRLAGHFLLEGQLRLPEPLLRFLSIHVVLFEFLLFSSRLLPCSICGV
jgi:hypothetical protein